ncbi:hypothetical protein [Paenarthrobacter sp. TA1.8]|uniref:hypothetical protein n=1 Tax=Paenarthrobacter sp. TA1.8 TaxID=3400219 RepID=UPI003B432BEF
MSSAVPTRNADHAGPAGGASTDGELLVLCGLTEIGRDAEAVVGSECRSRTVDHDNLTGLLPVNIGGVAIRVKPLPVTVNPALQASRRSRNSVARLGSAVADQPNMLNVGSMDL